MIDGNYLRRQAESCLTLSRATFDLGIASRLRVMADDLKRKAQELDDADGASYPRTASSRGHRLLATPDRT